MFQEQHRSVGYFRVKWGMDRTKPDHARTFRSILVKTLSLNEMGSHQKVLRQRVTGSDILFTFYLVLSGFCVVLGEGANVDIE